MKTIESIFAKYPTIFHDKRPVNYTEIPEGWAKLLEEFCSLIVMVNSDVQISEFHFHKIMCSDGFLDLEYYLSESLPEEDAFAIGAHAFSVKNRTYVGCVNCGKMIKNFPQKNEAALCELHRLQLGKTNYLNI